MITATITNVSKLAKGIVVFFEFSDGESKSLIFQADVKQEELLAAIKGEVVTKNELAARAEGFKELIGVVVS